MRRWLSVLVLVLLAPLVAEVLWGSTPFTQAGSGYLISVPIYGAGALLIRELVRRRGRGWPSILLLGTAYGIVEEGLALQDLFWSTQGAPYSAALRLFGVDWAYTIMVVPLHAIWSVAVPILTVELVFDTQRNGPYLGRFGLAVTGSFYTLGVAYYVYWTHTYLKPGYWSPAVLLGIAALAVLVLAVLALGALPRTVARPQLLAHAPSPWLVLLVTGFGGFSALGLLIYAVRTNPLFGQGAFALIPVASALVVVAGVIWLLWHWSTTSGWNDLHRLALTSGALLAHTTYGVLDIAQITINRIGLAGLELGMIILLVLFAFLVHRRVHREVDTPLGSNSDVTIPEQVQ